MDTHDTQNSLRQRILEIQRNPDLDASEKSRLVQHIMMERFHLSENHEHHDHHDHHQQQHHQHHHQHHSHHDLGGDPSSMIIASTSMCEPTQPVTDVLTEEDLSAQPGELQRHHHNEEENILGCKHYRRGAMIKAVCCSKFFVCRICHDEVQDHAINRYETRVMACMYCLTTQPVAQVCRNPSCGKTLARYYCNVCHLWDDDPLKNIYHCDTCHICRLGKGLGIDYFHCEKCGICMALSLKNNHRCIERSLESNCPICIEWLFASTRSVMFMPCGHCIHQTCYYEHIKFSYRCPICMKSLFNMRRYFEKLDRVLQHERMPEEYAKHRSLIRCNDCDSQSWTRYHFLYHKCSFCGSYNTHFLCSEPDGEVNIIVEPGLENGQYPGWSQLEDDLMTAETLEDEDDMDFDEEEDDMGSDSEFNLEDDGENALDSQWQRALLNEISANFSADRQSSSAAGRAGDAADAVDSDYPADRVMGSQDDEFSDPPATQQQGHSSSAVDKFESVIMIGTRDASMVHSNIDDGMGDHDALQRTRTLAMDMDSTPTPSENNSRLSNATFVVHSLSDRLSSSFSSSSQSSSSSLRQRHIDSHLDDPNRPSSFVDLTQTTSNAGSRAISASDSLDEDPLERARS